MAPSFIHLRVHTEYSLVDGLVRIKKLPAKLEALQMPAIAITDESNMFALVKFYKTMQSNGIKPISGADIWVEGAEGGRIKVKAMVTRRVDRGVVFVPFHFGGKFQGKDLTSKYPQGAAPYVVGEAANTATTYGYDPVTQMQETKVTLCKVTPA